MKRIHPLLTALLALALVAAAVPVGAQMNLGLSAGFVSATFTGDGVSDLDPGSVNGFSVGAWLGIPLGGRVSLAPGAYYVKKGASGDEPGTGTLTFDVGYLEIPVLLAVRLTPDDSSVGFTLFAGPEVAIEVGCDITVESGTLTATASCDDAGFDERKTLDFGALAGAGVQFPIGERLGLVLNGGIDLGLRSLDDSTDPEDIKNRAFFGSVAVVLPLGG
mgnify:CR=1 FL=1